MRTWRDEQYDNGNMRDERENVSRIEEKNEAPKKKKTVIFEVSFIVETTQCLSYRLLHLLFTFLQKVSEIANNKSGVCNHVYFCAIKWRWTHCIGLPSLPFQEHSGMSWSFPARTRITNLIRTPTFRFSMAFSSIKVSYIYISLNPTRELL